MTPRVPAVRALCLALVATGAVVLCLTGATAMAESPTVRDLYLAAQSADAQARTAMAQAPDRSDEALGLVRAAMRAYKLVVLRYPASGYCDDALWYGGQLGSDAFARFGEERERQAAIAQLRLLASEYPTSPFVSRAKSKIDHLAPPQAALPVSSARAATRAAGPAPPRMTTPTPSPTVAPPSTLAPTPRPLPASPPAVAAATSPAAPATNSRGGYSMARQLGMRVGRVVIDPGHGGSDPGTLGADLTEATVTLDVALKLEALLTQTAGVDVVLTRRSDTYVGLQERTTLANRDGADLFVSIHVNANRDPSIQGVETFLLNFASTPRAASVAARENADSTETMSHLNEVVKQIALHNKLDESRELATQLQTALVRRLRSTDKGLRDLGVKQAPFVVLIGASMPSVLVEMAFMTNRHEYQLLTTDAYRQRLAESLSDGVTRYLRSLKKADGVAGPPADKPVAKVR